MRSSNPALQDNAFSSLGYVRDSSETMTVQGTVLKTAILLLLALLTAGWTWVQFTESQGDITAISGTTMLGAIGGFAVALVTVFKKEWVAITAPLYALLEGLFLGGISAIFEAQYPGIVIQATIGTFATLGAMLMLYESGWIRVSDNFRFGVVAATGGIALTYLITFILSFFGVSSQLVFGSGFIGIAFSLFVIGIAALNFVLDFDFINQSSRRGVPKIMEWYGAFALMVTLVWLYIEFLRLISKLRSR